MKVVKNKVAPPFTECEFDIMYAEGISRTGSIIDLGVETKILEKKGAWISYKGKLIGQGREAAKDHLVKNPKDMEEISKEIMEKVQVVGGTTLGESESSAPPPSDPGDRARSTDTGARARRTRHGWRRTRAPVFRFPEAHTAKKPAGITRRVCHKVSPPPVPFRSEVPLPLRLRWVPCPSLGPSVPRDGVTAATKTGLPILIKHRKRALVRLSNTAED